MGDRSLLVLTDGNNVSPVIYSHWSGESIPTKLATLKERMKGREDDLQYAAARFVQIQTEGDTGNTGHGMWNASLEIVTAVKEVVSRDDAAEAAKTLSAESHGDAGFFVVNVKDFSWQCFGGYCEGTDKEYDQKHAA